MNVVGVDGCRGGWFGVALGTDRNWAIDVYKTINELWNAMNSPSMMLIDIPIGLPDTNKRICDLEARKLLGRRGSSIFTVPCRMALQTKSYRQACRINKQVMGIKISIQTWNIAAKIKEVDTWLQHTPAAQRRVRESHPELCFWALAGKHAMAHSKKTAQGFTERLSTLLKHCSQTAAIVEQALDQFRRKDLARDDILDALVLAVAARFSAGKPNMVPLKPPTDQKGRPMEIVYPQARCI